MNDSWGFKANDHSWKSAGAMLNLLADLASKGINYLLNIGPTAEGIVPDVSVRRLEEIGRWMDLNGEAIYGTSASPFAYGFDWGSMTQKGNTLYLMFSEWPGETFTLYGLRNKVHDARLLADPSQAIRLSQRRDEEVDNDVLELRLPTAAPDKYVSVVALDLDGPANVEPLPLQQPDGAVDLLATMADLHVPNRGSRISVSPGGVIQKWYNKRNWVSWKFKVNQPREFRVKVVTGTLRHLPDWIGGHRISVVVAGSVIDGEIRDDEKVETPQARYFPQVYTNLGRVRIDNPGTYVVKVRADKINQDAPSGLTLTSLRLE
jgi:alpha-L-fucosidase